MTCHGSAGLGAAGQGMGNIVKVDNSPAWERHIRIVALKQTIERMGVEMGKELYYFQAEKDYLKLDYTSFESYLGSPELAISRRTAFRLIRVYRRWVVELGYEPDQLTEAGTTKLDMLAAHVEEGSKDRYLNMAATLSMSDLQAQLTGREPVIRDWKSQLREARQLARALSQNANVPQEVMEFSLDYWRQTEAYE